jgi:hypothetical protein
MNPNITFYLSHGSGTILVKDGFPFLASSLFRTQIQGIGELIEDLIARIVPDPFDVGIYNQTGQ